MWSLPVRLVVPDGPEEGAAGEVERERKMMTSGLPANWATRVKIEEWAGQPAQHRLGERRFVKSSQVGAVKLAGRDTVVIDADDDEAAEDLHGTDVLGQLDLISGLSQVEASL